MRKISLVTILAMMFSLLLFTLAETMAGRASASNVSSSLAGAVSINDVTLLEGNSGTSNMVFTVTVTGSHERPIYLDYATANGGATAPSDYTTTSGFLEFPGTDVETTIRTISVPIIGDTGVEPDETFSVNLQIVDSIATMTDGQGIGTIINDEGTPTPTPTATPTPTPAPCTFTLSPSSAVFDQEGSSNEHFNVTTQAGCAWRPVKNVNWIQFEGNGCIAGNCVGSGSVDYSVGSNFGFFRSASISVAGQLFTVHQNALECPVELMCGLLPGFCPGLDDGPLSASRKFRDNVLDKTPRGQRYTRLYYQLSNEAVGIVMLNPMLVLRSRDVMERYMPVIQSMARGEQVTLTEGDMEEIDGFLRSFGEKGSPEFRESLKGLREDLRDPQVHGEFKITVTAGPKRALPEKSYLQSGKQASLMIPPFGLFLFAFNRRTLALRTTKKRNLRRLLWVAIPLALVGTQAVNGQSWLAREPGAIKSEVGRNRSGPNLFIPNIQRNFRTAGHPGSKPLDIHASPAYSSYFGGSQNEEGNSIAVDVAGNIYVTGFTDSTNFPLVNAAQSTFGGGQQDAFVTKFNSAGTQVLYSTYIGGNGQDNATSIAVDSSGNAYITGFTDSNNFPVSNALQPNNRGTFNAFVVKLSPAGAVLNSTLFGGSVNDYGSSIAVDSAGNVYIAGLATSADIPTANPLQASLGGLVDVFVAKINPSGTGLIYSTYLGASGIEGASSIAIDSVGNLYVTGLTSSNNFTTLDPLQATHGGGTFDAFVVKLNAAGTQLLYSTFLGGSGEDRAFRIAVDAASNAYVTGDTDSTNFPMLNALQPNKGGSADAFVAKINPLGNHLTYSTYLGGSGIEGGTAVAVDSAGSAFVTGFTASTNFPTMNALQPNLAGAYDGFVAKLNPSGSALDYSTYLGGTTIDSAFGIAMDVSAGAYVMGVTDSSNFPTANAFQGSNGGGTADVFIARLAMVPAPNTVQFESSSYTVSEGAGSVRIRVTRSGNLSPSTVEYVVTDGSALQRTDYTLAAGTISFAAGEGSRSFTLLIIDDVYVEGPETINLSLNSPSGGFSLDAASTATLTIQDNDTAQPSINPMDEAASFVRQHYYDFLNRLPDQGGLDYWTQQITQCGNDAQCIRNKRIDVSNAFFYELEFQESGAYIYRIYKAAFGTLPGAPNRANVTYAQFMPDRSRVIGGPQLDASKTEFANAFVQRPAFTAQYSTSMTAAQYVDALNANTGNSLTQAQRDALVSGLQSGAETRGTVLRTIADNAAFIDREYNASFVLTEYFGYLRRDPDQGGYDFWLGQVNRYPIRNVAVQHAMVCSFITSAEYQNRFSSVVTHTNAECPAP